MSLLRMTFLRWATAAAAALIFAGLASAVRIKDIAEVHGPMENPLVGTGLVVGLNGTGDDARFATSIKLLSNMLSQLGAESLPTEVFASRNVAVVSVSATLPKFNRIGDRLSVQVATVGNARSLEGGTLVLCPLMAPGPDGELKMYALASGQLKVEPDSPASAVIEGGAIIQKSVPAMLTPGGKLTFKLLDTYADFSVANSVVKVIHQDLNIDTLRGDEPVAFAVDAKTIEISLTPEQQADPVRLISQLEWLSVPGLSRELEARVVIDVRHGLFYAINGNVEISPVVVGYGDVQVEVRAERPEDAPTLDDLVAALRAVEATPQDVIGLLRAMEASGALHAKVIRR